MPGATCTYLSELLRDGPVSLLRRDERADELRREESTARSHASSAYTFAFARSGSSCRSIVANCAAASASQACHSGETQRLLSILCAT
mmetsp:Transcript_10857/g.32335  ORF Transcript_10857/g.32335 Transcript_10857/m.32335 type:complete len:88 (-) Transcript_10857:775-1038(-)